MQNMDNDDPKGSESKKQDQLEEHKEQGQDEKMTTSQGTRINDDHNSLT